MNWISVKEKLPQCGKEFLVTEEYEGKKFVRIATLSYIENSWHDEYGTDVSQVTNWMPLPPPPNE